ncbi:MAG: AtpZ/AtpI family protein [Firmicutes bacterium]|nr:AtpZ/AtpI family protein [Bacillota bacterium]
MNGSAWKALGFAMGIGVSLAVLIAAGVAGGRWLDARWHTEPLFTVAGLLAALGAGVYVLLRQVGDITGRGRS